MEDVRKQQACQVCGADGAGSSCGGCGMNRCAFGHHVVKWVLGILIISWVFSIGMKFGEVKAFLEMNGFYPEHSKHMPMMYGLRNAEYGDSDVVVSKSLSSASASATPLKK